MRMRTLNALRERPPLPAILSAIAAVVLTVTTATAGAPPTTHTIVIKQMHFEPAKTVVNVGDTVEWQNEDIFSHTATANNGSFDSGLIAPGQSWKMTVKEAGEVGYHCRPHPNMAASIEVGSGKQGASESGKSQHAVESLRFAPPRGPQELHPILVNFTAALLPLSLLSDILGRMFSRRSLHNAAWWLLVYAAMITPFTVAAGWWWKHAAGPDLPARLITVHQWLGTSLAVAFIVLALWRWAIHRRDVTPGFGYLVFATMVVLALVYQGSLGGAMVFGK